MGADAIRKSISDIVELARIDHGAARQKAAALTDDAHGDLFEAAVALGILRGFFDAARLHATTRSRSWPGTGYARATDDPHLIIRFGRFAAGLRALQALIDEAVVAEDVRRKASVARQYATALGKLHINGTIELLGASAASQKYGFDGWWRAFADHSRETPPLQSVESHGADTIAAARLASKRA